MTDHQPHAPILVTGGAGFIGSRLVESVLDRGDRVRVLDNFSTGKRENLERLGGGRYRPAVSFDLIEGDIRDLATVTAAMEGCSAVLHQAALGSVPRSVEDPESTHLTNVDGTLNVFLAARTLGIRRVVYASSSSVYGDNDKLPKREGDEGRPLSPYALTKQVNEAYARLFHDLYGVETIGLRYFNVYGPRQDFASGYAAVIPRFVSRLLAGKPPIVFGDGTQSRDFTFVEDVARANLLALDAPADAAGAAYNIGAGRQLTLLELLDILQDLLDTDVKPQFDPPRPGDVLHSRADTTRATEKFGYTAQIGMREGLEASIDYYRACVR